jgi:hypothetical protein
VSIASNYLGQPKRCHRHLLAKRDPLPASLQ